MNTITITTYNETKAYSFASCASAYFEHEGSRSYQVNTLGDFISKVAGYLTTKLLSFIGDEDLFNHIPALLWETEQIMRLAYKAAHQCEYYQALIVKACSCINETIKTVNELEHLDNWNAEFRCIIWTDRDVRLEGQNEASLEIYNEAGTDIESYYTL